ncbi:MAG: helix-hairpin-helix domain-containing protein [Polyangiales bacterium]
MRKLTQNWGLIALILGCAFTVPATTYAAIYDVFIDIETEDDLYDLLNDNQISDDDFDTLLQILREGVDINNASRERLYTLPNLTYRQVDAIIEYRKQVGEIKDPVDLVANGVISEEELHALAPFLIVRDRKDRSTRGWARYQTRTAAGYNINKPAGAPRKHDRFPPSMMLQTRLRTLENLETGGAMVLQRNRVGDVRYDASRNALSAEPHKTALLVPKLFAAWRDDKWEAIVGTYRIGFGQRLTFDSTNEYTPNGFQGDVEIRRSTQLTQDCIDSTGELGSTPCPDELSGVRVTPDFKWTNRLVGAAVGLKDLEVGKVKLQAYAWGSYTPNSIYQYEIYNQDLCDDPRNENDPLCSAPAVYHRLDNSALPTSTLSYQTLTRMYAEMIGGANFTLKFNDRAHVGITGYGAGIRWLVEGADLDFNDQARTPFGGPFGAVGMDAAFGFGIQDFFVEVAHSFDSQTGGGGGLGAILRSVTGLDKTEIEAVFRYYDDKFANPYARPISGADKYDGLRARDELGARLKTTTRFNKTYSLRTVMDTWYASQDDVMQMELYARGDAQWNRIIGAGVWFQFRDKHLGERGRTQCFDETNGETDTGDPLPCFGQRLRAAGRVQVSPIRDLKLSAQYQHDWRDDSSYDNQYRQDMAAIFTAMYKPTDAIRLRLRSRYNFDDIATNQREEQSLYTYVESSFLVRKRDWIRLRYDLRLWLDNRAATAYRRPSPEHWFWVEYRANF